MIAVGSDPLRLAALTGIFEPSGLLFPALKIWLVTTMPSDLGTTDATTLANVVNCTSPVGQTFAWNAIVDENDVPGYMGDFPVEYVLTADTPGQVVAGIVLADATNNNCYFGLAFDNPILFQWAGQKITVTPRALVNLAPLVATDFVQ